jgi:hypothetical protein
MPHNLLGIARSKQDLDGMRCYLDFACFPSAPTGELLVVSSDGQPDRIMLPDA